MRVLVVLLPGLLWTTAGVSDPAAPGWTSADSRAILDQTLVVELDPDISGLDDAEHRALSLLIEAGRGIQAIYEDQKHSQALAARGALAAALADAPSPEARDLATLYYLAKGPVVTTPDNRRVAFLPVEAESPGKNVYPPGLGREELDRAARRRPELLFPRGVVRRAGSEAAAADRDRLAAHPGLELLHPTLSQRRADAAEGELLLTPYAVAYADRVLEIARLVREAADLLQSSDPDLAAYLRLRAGDLLTENYEGGDAAWVLGRFGTFNVQLGSYETYDDALAGVKAFFGMSILLRDEPRSRELVEALGGIQALEDRLPYAHHKRVREDIPVGVYHVLADFGQARGGNTASILPNDADHARKYGRTILLRYNIMTHPARFQRDLRKFAAATKPVFHPDLTPEARFRRTLWHEIGHYLGVDRTADGRDLPSALGEYADLLEEMKSDLVSSFSAAYLLEAGRYTEAEAQSIYAAGVLRVLQDVEPRSDQPYQRMQLMQWNWLLDRDALVWDAGAGLMAIDYGNYPRAVTDMLAEVLAVQRAGDPERAAAFVREWTRWDDDVHGEIARRIRDARRLRYTLVEYGPLGHSAHIAGDSRP